MSHSTILKRQLARELSEQLHNRQMTQIEAAKTLGISQPRVSQLVNGNVTNFTIDYIVNAIVKLGLTVEVTCTL